MEVTEDQVIQPDGTPGSYATVKLKDGVSILPLDDDGFVYLTRQFRYAVGKESVEAASGGIDDGESALEAAKREVKEELGLEAEEWLELGVLDLDTSIVNCRASLFMARGLKATEPNREGSEQIQIVKMTMSEAMEQVMRNEITHGASCSLILKAWRTLGRK
jgi:8-oxo-dGTP pyrophosphatase MutT (NUDIX family)